MGGSQKTTSASVSKSGENEDFSKLFGRNVPFVVLSERSHEPIELKPIPAISACFATFCPMPFGYHTLVLSDEGLLAFGGKPTFEGDKGMSKVPHLVPWVGRPPVKVDWGRYHSLVLDVEGGVWEAGTPGVPNTDFTSNFQIVPGLPAINQISA